MSTSLRVLSKRMGEERKVKVGGKCEILNVSGEEELLTGDILESKTMVAKINSIYLTV